MWFASCILLDAGISPSLPITLPTDGEWLVRVVGSSGRFFFGEYRRHMKTIGYLGQLDKMFNSKVTNRSWNTMMAVARILDGRTKERLA